MEKEEKKRGALFVTLATYIFHIFESGIKPQNKEISELCFEIQKAANRRDPAQLKQAFRIHCQRLLPYYSAPDDDKIASFLKDVYGDEIFMQVDPHGLGVRMVSAIKKLFPDKDEEEFEIEDVREVLSKLFPEHGLKINFEQDRDLRLREIRSYLFLYKLPWMARLLNRSDDGSFAKEWILVEEAKEEISCMDPYPWDDVEEDFVLPVSDFMVRWELAGLDGIWIDQKPIS
ncbi:MAG: hypothetical protein CMK59_10285 [Proteobacteria bacterium]|nr:hypothetical protein [Pseudomonadota bacterium]